MNSNIRAISVHADIKNDDRLPTIVLEQFDNEEPLASASITISHLQVDLLKLQLDMAMQDVRAYEKDQQENGK